MIDTVRAITWAAASRVRARRFVHVSGLQGLALKPAPPLGLEHARTVGRVLTATRATCLVRSAVLQRWLADNGRSVDLVVGVTPPSKGFKAHAWLDLEAERHNLQSFSVIARVSPDGDLRQ